MRDTDDEPPVPAAGALDYTYEQTLGGDLMRVLARPRSDLPLYRHVVAKMPAELKVGAICEQ